MDTSAAHDASCTDGTSGHPLFPQDGPILRHYRRKMVYGEMHTLVEPPRLRDVEECLSQWLIVPTASAIVNSSLTAR